MKLNELMINDWVLLNGSKYRIKRIGDDGAIKLKHNCVGHGEIDVLLTSDYILNELQPIELTEDILAANGIKDLGDGLYENTEYRFEIDNQKGLMEFYMFDSDPESEDIYNAIRGCYYVHTLQHILNMCGLEEVARNFKID